MIREAVRNVMRGAVRDAVSATEGFFVSSQARSFIVAGGTSVIWGVGDLDGDIYAKWITPTDTAVAEPTNSMYIPDTLTNAETIAAPSDATALSVLAVGADVTSKHSFGGAYDVDSGIDTALAGIAAGTAGHKVDLSAALTFPYTILGWINAASAAQTDMFFGLLDEGEANNAGFGVGKTGTPAAGIVLTPVTTGGDTSSGGASTISVDTWYLIGARIINANDSHIVFNTTLSDAQWNGGANSYATSYDKLYCGLYYNRNLYPLDDGDDVYSPFVVNRDITSGELTDLVTNNKNPFEVFGSDIVGMMVDLTDRFTGKPPTDWHGTNDMAETAAPTGRQLLRAHDSTNQQQVSYATTSVSWVNNGGHGVTRCYFPSAVSLSVDAEVTYTNYAAGVHLLQLGINNTVYIKKQGGADDGIAQFTPITAS